MNTAGNIFSSIHENLEKKYPSHIGYYYLVFSNFWFSWHNYIVQESYEIPTFQLIFYQNVVIAFFVYYLMSNNSIPFYIHNDGKTNISLIIQGTLGFLAGICIFYGFQNVILSEAMVIFQTNPALVGILAAIFLGEGYSLAQFIITILNIIGVILVAKPQGIFQALGIDVNISIIEGGNRVLGIISLILSTFFMASTVVMIKSIVNKAHALTINFYTGVMGAIWNGLPMLFQPSIDINWFQFVKIMGVSWSAVGGLYYANKAFKHADAGKVTLLSYTQIIFGYLIEIFIQGKNPEIFSVFGASIILSCGLMQLYIVREDNKKTSEINYENGYLEMRNFNNDTDDEKLTKS